MSIRYNSLASIKTIYKLKEQPMIEKDRDNPTNTLLRIRKNSINNDYKLTKDDINKLDKLNNILIKYEEQLKLQILDCLSFANQKVTQKDDWINSQEGVEVELFFYIAQDDPDYKEYDDNIIMILTQNFYDNNCYGIDDKINHNDMGHSGFFYGKHHCWIFHSLYDHTQLTFEEILKIDSIDVNIILRLNNHSQNSLYKKQT
jgi:LysM repeat protein